MSDFIRVAVQTVLFVIFVSLVIFGHMATSFPRLFIMLLGLAGLIALLYSYNKRYK